MTAQFQINSQQAEVIRGYLHILYGPEQVDTLFNALRVRLETFSRAHPLETQNSTTALTQADSMLITYGDQIHAPDQAPLRTLADTLQTHLGGVISAVHLLPFFPFSSDDGFSVIDYLAVNPAWGSWDDIAAVGQNFELMFDAVINHISAHSEWFEKFLQDDAEYRDYFVAVDPQVDLSDVTRPRTHPLLTEFETNAGPRYLWTTFSADQIDLNYANPNVLLAVIDVLFAYVAHGARFIRLDAIGYLWKEIGTTCIHLPQTHTAIQLMRALFDAVAPAVKLITETNVPHQENISYFGDGHNEAQLVYNFSLPPLTLHTLHTGNATVLQQWAAGLSTPSSETAFFNFTASHDGIGVMPAKGLLRDDQIEALAQKVKAHGGLVSYKTNSDGSQSPYELNITFFDALSDPQADESQALQVDRFMVSQAMMLALPGVPGIYVHSIVGSHNDLVGVQETGRARSINRQKWLRAEFESAVANEQSIPAQVLARYKRLLATRRRYAAFNPNSPQQIVFGNPAIFALWRTTPSRSEQILCLHNVSAQPQTMLVPTVRPGQIAIDVISGQTYPVTTSPQPIQLAPYQVLWLFMP